MRGRREEALDLIWFSHIVGRLPELQGISLPPKRYLPVKILLYIFSFLISDIDSKK